VENQATVVENVVDAASKLRVSSAMVTYPGAITVYNVNGVAVARGTGNVDVHHLSRGIYIVQGRNGSHVETAKVAIGS